MKLCSFTAERTMRVGVLMPDGKVADVNYAYAALLSSKGSIKPQQMADVITPANMIGLIESGETGKDAIGEAMAFLAENTAAAGPQGERILYAQDEIKFEAPVPNPSKIFSIAINNKQKFEIADKPEAPHPLYFIKVPTCITGPYDPVEIPDIGVVGSEAEVAFVIGKKGKFIPEDQAESYVYGYTVHNDITAHELRDTKEWIVSKRPEGDKRLTYAGRYKCFDTFAPMGPWLTTADEVPDINNVEINAYVNDKLVQTGNTGDMFFKIPLLVNYLSGAHTLLPGDIVSWGTVQRPIEGVNFQKIDLRGWGGVLITEASGLGTIKNPIKAI
ncbi:MAG TPA: fumarylacetoacetate hydrolase family protein [Anaerovoracaceae bacterium]|nr:fumarylacetoacetate hydrolase family protein [Anaerovoracaceae bacterium]